MKRAIILLSTMLAAFASAQTLADAQKAYVAGNWKEAAAAYSAACPKEPQDKQAECWLWNVLALSQTGDAKSFKEAGKRLDSLIQVVNPQKPLYTDLMMTSAQFRLYLGKYDKSAEALIHAIETAQPNQYVVLQKVCQAVKVKYHSDDLVERCNMLDNPEAMAQAKANAQAMPASSAQATPDSAVSPVAVSSSSVVPVAAVSSSSALPASSAIAPAPTSSSAVQAVPASSAVQAAAPVPQAQSTPAEEYWVLQIGAFGVKDNANMLVSSLKKNNISATIVEQPRGEKILYLVQSGHFATKEAAVDYGAKRLAPLKVEFQPLPKK